MAQIPGYRIAGKTGTAERLISMAAATRGAKITSFIGIVPVESPAMVAVVDEPRKGIIFGSTVAAPIVKSVISFTIERIPPVNQ